MIIYIFKSLIMLRLRASDVIDTYGLASTVTIEAFSLYHVLCDYVPLAPVWC